MDVSYLKMVRAFAEEPNLGGWGALGGRNMQVWLFCRADVAQRAVFTFHFSSIFFVIFFVL